MKILVTGQNSYAGTQFNKRITELYKGWKIDFISVRNNDWEHKDFSSYDAIYHVAGIVHKKETASNQNLYYTVNRDLTYQLAIKAQNEGVKSFVFLSTMAVYGLIGKIGEDTVISKQTLALPTSAYGKSKLEAEELLSELKSPYFNISILRIPMIYGPDCPGNYSSLSKLVRKTPVFPKIDNKRSMIFVDHLSDIVAHIIDNKLYGVFLVKNPEDINTLKLVNEIAKNNDKKIHNSNILGVVIKKIGNNFTITRKLFGNVFINLKDSEIEGFKYNNLSFEKSIFLSEKSEMYKGK